MIQKKVYWEQLFYRISLDDYFLPYTLLSNLQMHTTKNFEFGHFSRSAY